MNTIVIFGQFKTGTTVIFYKIRESLPAKGVHLLFEPDRYVPPVDPVDKTVLAKVILGVDNKVEYEDFLKFEYAIYIVRDPRDWLISGLLFVCQQLREIWSREDHTQVILNLLRQKETAPTSVSVHDLLREIVACTGWSTEELLKWITRQQRWLVTFESKRQFHVLRYEHFVAGNYSKLESYLGIDLTDSVPVVPTTHSHTARTRSFGNWKSWFVEADIELFRPVFEDYISRHHYDPSWQLDALPVISPEHSSQYVRRIIDRRRKIAARTQSVIGSK